MLAKNVNDPSHDEMGADKKEIRGSVMIIKERPILMSAPMVRAILDGRKTQTRRIIKPQPYIDGMGNFCWNGMNFGQDFNVPRVQAIVSPIPSRETKRVYCPFGKSGDHLWVRETFSELESFDFFSDEVPEDVPDIWYWSEGNPKWGNWTKPKPSIHMPRYASRINLEITNIRVERLQDISEEDAISEGLKAITKDGRTIKYGIPDSDGLPGEDDFGWPWHEWSINQINAYRTLWEKINGKGSWDANPYVWVIEFRKI